MIFDSRANAAGAADSTVTRWLSPGRFAPSLAAPVSHHRGWTSRLRLPCLRSFTYSVLGENHPAPAMEVPVGVYRLERGCEDGGFRTGVVGSFATRLRCFIRQRTAFPEPLVCAS